MASPSPSFFAVDNTSNPYARKPSLENAHTRRSACDRCRAHKLRCVRPVAVAVDDTPLASRNDTTLTPCERCVKAGVECVRLARGRRSPAIRQSGYERRLARPSPLSPSAFNQAPVSRHVAVPASGGKVNVYHDNSAPPLTVFPSPLSAHAPRDDCTSSQMQSAMSAAMDYQHHDSLFEAGSAADAHAMSGEFPSSLLQTSGGQRAGHDVSYGLSELELDMMASSSPLGGGGGGGMPNDMPSSNPLREPPESGLGQPVGQNDKTMTPMECLQAAGPPRTKHECLRRLSGLTMKLLDCLSAAEDHPITLQDILAYRSAPPTPGTGAGAGAGAGTSHELTPCKNIIGFLLESSQDFLDAVEGLRDLMERQDRESSYDSYPNSDYSAADSQDTPVFLDGEPLARTQNDDRDTTYSQFSGTTLHTSSAGDTAAAAAAAPPPPPRQPGGVSSRQGGYCSGPTTLTIMTCYLWLFHGYEAVFAAIHDALVAQNQQRLDRRGSHTRHHNHHQEHRRAGEAHDTQQQQQQQHSSPPRQHGFLPLKSSKAADLAPTLLPDLRIGGFHLDGHPHLQIEMLIYLSCRILRQMETVLGIDARPAAAAAAEADPPQPPPTTTTTTTTGKHPAEAGGVSAPQTHHGQRERSFLDPRCTSGFLRSFLCASSSSAAAAAVDSSAEDDGRDDRVGRGGSLARSTLIDGRVQKIRRILDII
ncbi:Cytochalasin cluster regulator ccsR [Colletotrichum trifolii]|uniref:Cytochalasin cluster regulator ccsR n=1 Tax=Colletotrichum trifolii TaxID=5466 RepID=A0A4R8RL30_COLTR|nr:Cytochalasin cluster regulator ccsR [Colletotrichum trifolii]